MKILALVLALGGLGTGVYAVTGPFVRYGLVHEEWMRVSMSGGHGDPREAALSDDRTRMRSECQTLVLAILPSSILGLLLALVALRKPGRALPIVTILLALAGAGTAGIMLAEGVF